MVRWWTLVALLGCLAGCRTAATDSPETTFAAFDRALRQGDWQAATEQIDFAQMARQANADWDSFPASQQRLIASKMREETEQGLASWGYPTTGMDPTPARREGTEAVITANGGGQTLTLTLQESASGWKITGGVPGMTSTSGMSGE